MKFAINLLTHLERKDLIDLCREPPGPKQLPVVDFFNQIFREKTQAQWVEELGSLDICFAPVNDLRTALDLPQTRHRQMVVLGPDKREHLGIPIKYRNEPGSIRFESPELGEHTEIVLKTVGYNSEDLKELRSSQSI